MRYLYLLFIFLFPKVLFAQEPEILGTYSDWTGYVAQDLDGKVCYASTEPIQSVGKYKKRDDVFLIVTHRPNQNSYDVISVVAGYTYKKGSKPLLTVDKKKSIELVAIADNAWAKTSKIDKEIVEQFKVGSSVKLKGYSVRGTATMDTFSLKGFSKAYGEITEACKQ